MRQTFTLKRLFLPFFFIHHQFANLLASNAGNKKITMGKGDKRTTRGKIWRGSHGKSRPKKANRPQPPKKEEKKNG